MAIERASGGDTLDEVLDGVLDKGIVIDAWARASLGGIGLLTGEARVVVVSIATCPTVGQLAASARPAGAERRRITGA